MSQGRWLLCFWPGLAELWLAGSWSGLFQAIGFCLLLNAGLCTTLIWTELLPPELRFAGWTAVGTLWLMGVWSARRSVLARREPDRDLFSSALSEYLQGNWFAAEARLDQLIKSDARDLEAQLLLATMFRRTGRLAEARSALDKLSRAFGGEKWELEVQRERALLDQTVSPASVEPSSQELPAIAQGSTNTSRAA